MLTLFVLQIPDDWQSQQETFVNRIACISFLHNVPKELVVNMDQTGLNCVPSNNYTRVKKGQKHVKILGVENKKQLTLLPAISASGEFLPFQIVYAGKSEK